MSIASATQKMESIEWEKESAVKPAKTQDTDASGFEKCVDKTDDCSRPALKAGAQAVCANLTGTTALSKPVDDAVDCSMDTTKKVAKGWCTIF